MTESYKLRKHNAWYNDTVFLHKQKGALLKQLMLQRNEYAEINITINQAFRVNKVTKQVDTIPWKDIAREHRTRLTDTKSLMLTHVVCPGAMIVNQNCCPNFKDMKRKFNLMYQKHITQKELQFQIYNLIELDKRIVPFIHEQ